MSVQRFFKELSLTSLLAIGLMCMLHFIPQLADHSTFSWASCAFFILLSILIYIVGYRAAKSSNKHAFTSVIMGFVLVKMVFSLVFLIIVFNIIEPVSRFFLVPFFVSYLIYTIFETYVMTKLAKMESNNSQEEKI